MQLILASASPYRRALLARLELPFQAIEPRYVERSLDGEGETPAELVLRHAEGKARSLAAEHPRALIIGADQVAVLDGGILGKPGSRARARGQLSAMSGREVVFLTGLCLYNSASNRLQSAVERYEVTLRSLEPAEIERYLEREPALDCAGAIKVEGLGITLLRRVIGEDPNCLVGLPLIRLLEFLRAEGCEPL